MKRIALPSLLCLIGLFLLVGCLYIPTFEHQINQSQHDFRNLIGDVQSKKPIRPYAIYRDQVIKLLGPPQLVSEDNTSVGYVVETEYGYWLYPFCFTGQADHSVVYLIRLKFDEDGLLRSYDAAQTDDAAGPFGIFAAAYPVMKDDPYRNIDGALQQLNATDPKLHARRLPAYKQSLINMSDDANWSPTTRPTTTHLGR